MFKAVFTCIMCLLLSTSVWNAVCAQDIFIEPHGLGVSAEFEDSTIHEMRFNNFTDLDLEYSIRLSLPPDEERRRGPRRDELGDAVTSYNVPAGNWFGIAWDGERMWGVDYTNRNLIAVDPANDGEVERIGNWDNGQGALGMTYDGETFWICSWNTGLIYQVSRDGETLETIDPPGNTYSGIAWDGEYLWYCDRQNQTYIRQIDLEGEVLRTLEMPDDVNLANVFVSIAWVDAHREGKLWVGDSGGALSQVAVDPDIEVVETELIQQGRIEGTVTYDISHDEENLWYTFSQQRETWFVVEDGIEEPKWLTVYPFEGRLRSNDEAIILLTIQPGDLEAGVYERRMIISLFDVDDDMTPIPESPIEISVVMSLEIDAATIVGVVSDYDTHAPIRSAKIDLSPYLISRYTNRAGEYEMEHIPLGLYDMTYSADDYLTETWDMFIDDEGVFDADAELRHSTCDVDIEEIVVYMSPEDERVVEVTATNNGNGPLTFTAECVLPEEVQADPWDLRRFQVVGNEIRDHRPAGVVFAEGHFFVTAGGNDTNMVYKLDRDGELVESYVQHGGYRYGMKDLAWDGELLWGCSNDRIYGFEPDGDLDFDFEGPDGYRSIKGIAWDRDREVLWVCDITRDIIGFDRDGSEEETLDRKGLYIYGLAYWPEDPDGYNLYLLTSPRDSRSVVFKMNPDNGDTMYVTEFYPENGARPAGAYITKHYDGYSWVFMSMADAGGRNDFDYDGIYIHHLSTNYGMMRATPDSGVLEPDESGVIAVTLNSEGLFETDVSGDLVIDHDGVGGGTIIPISMNIVVSPRPPLAFHLLEPDSGDTISIPEVTFSWDPSIDPNPEDVVRYNFWISIDQEAGYTEITETSFTGRLDTLGIAMLNDRWVDWWVTAISNGDTVESVERKSFYTTGLAAPDGSTTPAEFALEQVYPNPFNAATTVTFSLDRRSAARVDVLDLSGRRVETLHSGALPVGRHRVVWDGQHIASGVYFVRLQSDGRTITRRVALVR